MKMELSQKQVMAEFWRFAKPEHKSYILSFVLMFLTLLTELARPFILKDALDKVEQGNLHGLHDAVMVLFVILVVDYLVRGGFSYIVSMAFLQTINRLRDEVFSSVLRMKMAYFDTQPVGKLMTRITSDPESLAESLRSGVATIFVDVFTVLIVFFVMLRLDLGLTPVLLLSAPLVYWSVKWCGEQLQKMYIEVRKTLAESNGSMAEGIAGAEILQLFKKEAHSLARFHKVNTQYRDATIISNVYDAGLYAIVDGIAGLVTAGILYVGFYLHNESLDVAGLIVYLNLVDKIFVPIRDMSGKVATLQQSMAALQRIFELKMTPAHIVQGEKELPEGGLDVVFHNVSFRYKQDGPHVLRGVSFQMTPGEVVALVGQTGSGKSTIGKLLTRAYDGYEGAIRVGGVELRNANYHSLRQRIAVVQQDVELFPGTLRENIGMFNPGIDDAKIHWAIGLVKAQHMVAELPGGLDFEVKENGGNLSTGQMQLIVFARALAHDAPVILMDEATASIDSMTEAWIQEAIFEIFKHKTVLVVAHRLSTIAAADKILVLKNGEILEEGNHEQLAARVGGYYAQLVEASRLEQDSAVLIK